MNTLKYAQIERDIQSALKLCGLVKLMKITLALLVVLSYFLRPDLLLEIMVVAVITSLILPLGFFDEFVQKLLEYNTQKVEERQILNANEANENFEKIYKKVGK